MGEVRALSLAPSAQAAELERESWPDPADFDVWRIELRRKVLTHLSEFVAEWCASGLQESGVEVAGDILVNFVAGGKCLRSTFMYLGWLAGAADSEEALFASASLELLHAFALMQDDVMDASSSRRGRPAAHVEFSQWHRKRTLSGPADRFGESAAILLGDLCLIWAE
jgi:geranylgeranyl diphosphate synthase, type I